MNFLNNNLNNPECSDDPDDPDNNKGKTYHELQPIDEYGKCKF